MNSLLFCSYNIASILLNKFGLIVEYTKMKMFHFSRSNGVFNPPPLDLSTLGGPILHPKKTWKYLGFIFDKKLSFCQHINFYANKAISTVKYMKILSNLVHKLIPNQKWLLYRSCVLSIALYGFQLWFYNRAPLSYSLKILRKMQKRIFLWILGAFQTLPFFGIKAIAGLIPIHLHIQKLSGRSHLRAHALLSNYILQSLLESRLNIPSNPHHLSLCLLTKHQWEMIKGPVVDMNRFNEVFPSFDPLNLEFAPNYKIIKTFSSYFSFHSFNKCNNDSLLSHSCQLNNLAIMSSENLLHALIITNASIRNNVAISIAYVHIHNRPVIKTLHYAVNINSMKAKLFTIRYSIYQATSFHRISKIVIITDSIHSAKRIFNSLSYPFQIHTASILCKL